jgi:hypothetical protein
VKALEIQYVVISRAYTLVTVGRVRADSFDPFRSVMTSHDHRLFQGFFDSEGTTDSVPSWAACWLSSAISAVQAGHQHDNRQLRSQCHSPLSHAAKTHHKMSAATTAQRTATRVRVTRFECSKHRNKNAARKDTVLADKGQYTWCDYGWQGAYDQMSIA